MRYLSFILSLLLLLFCQAAITQDNLWEWELTRRNPTKLALIDGKANLITGFDFEESKLGYNSKQIALKKAEKWGFFDWQGKEIVPFLYEEVNDFYANRTSVKQNGKWGVIDTNGVFLLQPQFDFPLYYIPQMGFYSYIVGEKTGFVDTLGNILSPPLYYDVEGRYAENGLLYARIGERRYPGVHGTNMNSCCTVLIDRKGQNITGEKYTDIHTIDKKMGIYETTNGTYLDTLGRTLPLKTVPSAWDYAYRYDTKHLFFTVKKELRDTIVWNIPSEKEADFVESINGIQKASCPSPPTSYTAKITLEGIVNLNGEIIIPIEYEDIEVIKANVFLAKKNKKYGIIDSVEKELLPFVYENLQTRITAFPIVITKQDSFLEILDVSKAQKLIRKYRDIIQIDQSSSGYYEKQRFLLVKNNKYYGLIDSLGRERIPCQFVEIKKLTPLFFKVNDGNAWGICDTGGKMLQPCIYQEIEKWDATKCEARINGKIGILAINGTWIVKPKYDGIVPWGQAYKVYKKPKLGLLNQKGRKITPIEYEFVESKYYGREGKVVKRHGKYGLLQSNGKLVIPTKYDDYTESAPGAYITMIKKHPYHPQKQNFSYEGKKLDSLAIAQAETKLDPPTQRDIFMQTVKAKYPNCQLVNNDYMPLGGAFALQQGKVLYGICNRDTKKEILPTEYEEIKSEHEGLFIVRKNQKLGIVDSFNQIKIPFLYDTIWGQKKGSYRVCKARKWGLIDTVGKEIVPCRFDETSYLQNGYVIVLENGRMGLWTQAGKEIIPPTYVQYAEKPDFFYTKGYEDNYGFTPSDWKLMQYAPNFLVLLEKNKIFCVDSTGKRISHKYAKVSDFMPTANKQFMSLCKNHKLLFLNQKGKEVLQLKNAKLKRFNSGNKEVRELIPISKKGKWALYHAEKGKIKALTPYIYDEMKAGNLVPYIHVGNKDKVGLLSRAGKVVLPAVYDEYEISKDYRSYRVRKGEKWGLIDSTLKTVLPIQYDSVYIQKNSILVLEKGKWGMFDEHYHRLLASEYDLMSDIIEGCIVVEKNKMCAVINSEGKILLSYRPQGISIIDSTHYILSQDCVYQLTDNQGVPLTQDSYHYLNAEFNQFLIAAEKNQKLGLIDYRNGKEILPFEYESIEYYATGNFVVQKNEMYGMIDSKGKEIQPFIYVASGKEGEGFIFQREGRWESYDIYGKKVENEYEVDETGWE